MARFSDVALYANNSVIDINLVGEGFATDGGALECHTDDTTCCSMGNGTDGRGDWYYPNGTLVPPGSAGVTTGFYRTRADMVVRLNRVDRDLHAISLTGVYRCEIPGAGGVTLNRYIELSNGG